MGTAWVPMGTRSRNGAPLPPRDCSTVRCPRLTLELDELETSRPRRDLAQRQAVRASTDDRLCYGEAPPYPQRGLVAGGGGSSAEAGLPKPKCADSQPIVRLY